MDGRSYDRDELARRSQELYEQHIREELEADAANEARFVTIDVQSGDLVVANDALGATAHLRQRRPDAPVYLMRVGRPAAFRLGGRFRATRT